MVRHTIFTNSIVADTYPNEKLKNLILHDLELHKKIGGRDISNHGGFQTQDLTNENILGEIHKKSEQLILANYKLFAKKIKILNVWINVNKKRDFNKIHLHPGSHFSGIYYLNGSKKGGELEILRDDATLFSDQSQFLPDDTDFITTFKIQPKDNLFILFPSQLKHMVLPHYDEGERISVSFNIGFF
jgi:uncharacterized protein (TIGR02466 family)|tara:strand:+ start:8112 stop:8672 length:561 start_codon:yes stop_codon:yes gene_type:complete